MYSIGLDVSKSTINVYIPIKELDIQITNDFKSLKSLYSKLKKYYKKEVSKLVFVYEPTGSYSVLLSRFCNKQLINCFIVNPKKSVNFSKAIGNRNKTDIDDARMLSQMIVTAKEQEIKIPVINKTVDEIKELISYYRFLIKEQQQNANHLEAVSVKEGSPLVIKTIKQILASLKKKEQIVLLSIKDIIASDKKLYKSYLNIQTIKGIGEISAIVLLHHFIKYPNTNQRQIVSLAGLDPVHKSSGTSIKGKAKISKAGCNICRSTLFMATIVAVQHNEELKTFYNRLKDNGKHTTVAQIAVMRKMVVLAHTLYKNNEVYDPNRFKQI